MFENPKEIPSWKEQQDGKARSMHQNEISRKGALFSEPVSASDSQPESARATQNYPQPARAMKPVRGSHSQPEPANGFHNFKFQTF